MVKKKRQHFVPRFLLKHFSNDGRSISLLHLESGRRIPRASLREQCYRDYFYGKDETIENGLAEEEDKIAVLLRDLSSTALESLSVESLTSLKRFAHLQAFRTARAAEQFAAEELAHVNHLLSLFPGSEDFIAVREGGPSPSEDALYRAALGLQAIEDLCVKFVVNDKKVGFVISDHPVLMTNQFAEHHPRFKDFISITGLTAKGLQMFLPLSPSVMLAVYDGGTYEYGGSASNLCNIGLHDIRALNALQATNAESCVYFSSSMPDAELGRLEAVRRAAPDRQPLITTEQLYVRGRTEPSEIVRMRRQSLRLGRQLGFVRQLATESFDRYDGIVVPPRSAEILEESFAWMDALEAQVQAQVAAKRSEVNPPSPVPGS